MAVTLNKCSNIKQFIDLCENSSGEIYLKKLAGPYFNIGGNWHSMDSIVAKLIQLSPKAFKISQNPLLTRAWTCVLKLDRSGARALKNAGPLQELLMLPGLAIETITSKRRYGRKFNKAKILEKYERAYQVKQLKDIFRARVFDYELGQNPFKILLGTKSLDMRKRGHVVRNCQIAQQIFGNRAFIPFYTNSKFDWEDLKSALISSDMTGLRPLLIHIQQAVIKDSRASS